MVQKASIVAYGFDRHEGSMVHIYNFKNFILKYLPFWYLFVLRWNTSTIFCLQTDSESIVAGKAAIGNLLGGIGYFYGQSKIALPKDSNVSNLHSFFFFFHFYKMENKIYNAADISCMIN